jgi:guanylate kinase|tara:strand:+ start:709 stop:1341 length:633 start_codon:yes stop_codon:yes gene_type:complete
MILKEKSMMIVLSSPSGAGKTTLTKKLQRNNSNFHISISYTTREPRPNEVNGKDYYFVPRLEFEKLIQNKNFYEYATIFENYYGTPKEPVEKLLSSGKDILFDIDWQGTQQLKEIKSLPLLTFFIIPPDIQSLKDRLLQRNQDKKKSVEQRMSKFKEEIIHWKEYDYVVVNDNLDICYNKILETINSEKKGIKEAQDKNKIELKIKDLLK